MEIKPEIIGAIVGGAILTIASGMGIIQRRGNGGHKAKRGDTDEIDRVRTVIDIIGDLRDEIAVLEGKLEQSKDECAKRIDEIVEKYDRQLGEMAIKNAELKRRLDEQEGGK